MTYKEVAAMVKSIGIPTAYYQFPENTEQATPFVCFYFTGDNDFLADNSNYQAIETLVVEVYADDKNFDLEQTVESVLKSADMVWSKEETYIDTEKMFETIYTMDVIITKEN